MDNLDGYMNKSYGAMMEGAKSANKQDEGRAAHKEERRRKGQQHLPHIHVHPHHDKMGAHIGTTVHTMHHDGRHEAHEFGPGDHHAVGEHVTAQLSGEGSSPEGHEAAGEELLAGER